MEFTRNLKTLKEIEFSHNGEPKLSDITKPLRQEAIKWIKENKKGEMIYDISNNPKDVEWAVYDFRVQTWIQHFFNISDEDLK